MRGLLLINPRSGTESPTAVELQDEALARGVHAQVLERGEGPAEPGPDGGYGDPRRGGR